MNCLHGLVVWECLSQKLRLIKNQSFNKLLVFGERPFEVPLYWWNFKHFELIAPLCHNLDFVAARDYFSIGKIILKFASCYIVGTSFYWMLYWEQ